MEQKGKAVVRANIQFQIGSNLEGEKVWENLTINRWYIQTGNIMTVESFYSTTLSFVKDNIYKRDKRSRARLHFFSILRD